MPTEKIALAVAGLLLIASTGYIISETELTKELNTEKEPEIQIEVLSKPVAGETNTLQASKNGTPLSGEKLYINGESYGKLNKAGIKEFNVPNKQKITIEVSDATKTLETRKKRNQTSEATQDSERPEEGLSLRFEPEAGEYNYITLYNNNSEPVEGEEIFVNGDSIGTTNSQGEIGFRVTNKREVKISRESGLEEITRTVESNGEVKNYSFNIKKPLIRGYNHTITLKEKGEAVEGIEVFVEGVNQGKTNASGHLTFETPLSEHVTLLINTDEGEYSETFETSYVNFEIIMPEKGGTEQDYESRGSDLDIKTEVKIETNLDGEYRVFLDKEKQLEGFMDAGNNEIIDYVSAEEGQSELYVEYESNNKTVRSHKNIFKAEHLEEPFTFDLKSPEKGESINNSAVEFHLNSSTKLENPYDISLILDNQTLSSDKSITGDWGERYIPASGLTPGSHEWFIKVKDPLRDRTIKSETRTFETTVQEASERP